MLERKMSPVLKWAGGKTQLLGQIAGSMPSEYNNYYEPFIGGAALLLNVQPKKAHINDVNEQLINMYLQLRDNADAVIKKIETLDKTTCDKDFYFSTRDAYNEKIKNRELDAQCAALMIWINKHCFNGLYRVNSKGLFNVPYNNKTSGTSIVKENLRGISEYLKTVDISCGDFEAACSSVKKNDFVYFDSPYLPESKTADFTSYTKDGFTMEDHIRLAELFKKLSNKGAHIMLSNNDVPLVYELYAGFNISNVDARRFINCDANNRKGKEVIITNY